MPFFVVKIMALECGGKEKEKEPVGFEDHHTVYLILTHPRKDLRQPALVAARPKIREYLEEHSTSRLGKGELSRYVLDNSCVVIYNPRLKSSDLKAILVVRSDKQHSLLAQRTFDKILAYSGLSPPQRKNSQRLIDSDFPYRIAGYSREEAELY